MNKLLEKIAPLVQDLNDLGININEPYDLGKIINTDDRLLDIYLKHLQKSYPNEAQKWIATALDSSNIILSSLLLDIFSNIKGENTRLRVSHLIADENKRTPKSEKQDPERIKRFIYDNNFEDCTSPLISLVYRLDGRNQINFFLDCIESNKPVVIISALKSLGLSNSIKGILDEGNHRIPEIMELVSSFIDHNSSTVRSTAKATLKKLETVL